MHSEPVERLLSSATVFVVLMFFSTKKLDLQSLV